MRSRERNSEAAAQDRAPCTTRDSMRKPRMMYCGSLRQFLVLLMVLTLISLGALVLQQMKANPKPYMWMVDRSHIELVHSYVRSMLSKECRPAFARREMEARFNHSSQVTEYFLWRDTPLTTPMLQYPPPFGFRDLQGKLKDILSLLPRSIPQKHDGKACHRCVVVGNGGVLRGLALGHLIDQFDMVIRLNSGPVRDFSEDVGKRTDIRMSYPEGTPRTWDDVDPNLQFVAVVYKSVDFNWLKAMITREGVSLWDWLFFWQKVPDEVPLRLSQFRILNPEIIRETALDLLHLPEPQSRIWGWDQNVPTIGVSALNLATYLCDEVSLAGFGYNLSQEGVPLHYYDSLPMASMLQQPMHNVDRERMLLRQLAEAGVISDLTGGVHCSFCAK
ncbi:lactosylceramide alpha-2,3-sialyltransferase [Megalops cyprinoides]|uniref:lactosylceramide alpha-2,3-sialyltransferase n=1 Tax=Megalops cyprinoides TaxID=118141 RepID=UPI001864D0B9|nr:lactosylceramide alpha-2,3-sialyltransferase [Megalops cyprinoides]